MSSRCDSASHCFAFEQDFIGSWRCILCVRRKLDLVGVKLKLNHWLTSKDQRQPWWIGRMAPMPSNVNTCDSTRMPDGMVKDLPPVCSASWQKVDELPALVQEAATVRGVQLTLEQWALLSELDRFALCKLARPGHDHHNLEAAFSEVLV